MAKRYRTLADYFRDCRETQEALALRVGVSQAHISRIVSGGPCSLGLAKRIAAATGVPMDSLGNGQEEVA